MRSQSADYYSGNTELPGRGVLFGQKQILDKEEFLSDGELILSRCYWADVVVWEADLIVGKWSDSTVTYLGYGSGIFPEAGSLDVTTFEYDGENYTIENLVLQQVTGGIEQLILNADKRLPNDFYFQVGDYLFAISDSLTVGLHQNIHAWREVESLDWQGGENVLVALIAELESGSQQTELFQGPEPTDLPVGIGLAGTLEAGDSLSGEIEAPRKFMHCKLVLEPGERYRIDVNGAATGNGTLSDPWISGIRGAFYPNDGPQMQPVWDDEQSRTLTQITLPSGELVQIDQYGRVFTIHTDSQGGTILHPSMGANDHGGRGFNSRHYLVNFPATEYVLTVSGAPNPSGTGSYGISVADVSDDDFPARCRGR